MRYLKLTLLVIVFACITACMPYVVPESGPVAYLTFVPETVDPTASDYQGYQSRISIGDMDSNNCSKVGSHRSLSDAQKYGSTFAVPANVEKSIYWHSKLVWSLAPTSDCDILFSKVFRPNHSYELWIDVRPYKCKLKIKNTTDPEEKVEVNELKVRMIGPACK